MKSGMAGRRMILAARRSIARDAADPRTAVLACGFGFGIAVMAALLGVGAVILEQAHSPALAGGGDLVVLGRFGAIDSARFVMASVLGAPDLARQRRGRVAVEDAPRCS